MLRCGARVAHELCAFFSSGIAVDLEQLPDDYEVGCLAGAGAVRAASLDAEAKRGAKLSCHLCGLKGATLGCYSCSRRSYHYPCAQRAGLVEWHWWESGHRARVVHCAEHLDARVDVRWDDGRWHGAAVVDGPHEGRYLALYTSAPFGQESLALNESDVSVRRPPTGAAKWAAFGRLSDACQRCPAIVTRLAAAPAGPKRVRVVLDGGAPLDGLNRAPPSVAAAARKRKAVEIRDRPLARPHVVTAAERVACRAALVRAEAGPPPAAAVAVVAAGAEATGLVFRSVLVAELAAAFLDLAGLDAVAALCRGGRAALRAPRARLLPALLLRLHPEAADAWRRGCYGADAAAALRSLDVGAADWAAAATDSAGPGGTSLRSTRGRGRPAAVHKTGKASGDVTVAATYAHPAVRCHCFEVDLSLDAGPARPPRCAVGVALGAVGLHAPSPFWLGREPRDGSAGRAYALDLSTGLVHGTTLASRPPVGPEFPAGVRGERSITVGVVLDLRGTHATLAFFIGPWVGVALAEADGVPAGDFDLVRPAVSLRDLGWKATLRPAVPAFGDADAPTGLARPPHHWYT